MWISVTFSKLDSYEQFVILGDLLAGRDLEWPLYLIDFHTFLELAFFDQLACLKKLAFPLILSHFRWLSFLTNIGLLRKEEGFSQF